MTENIINHDHGSVYIQVAGVEHNAVEDGYVFYDTNERVIIYLNLTAAAIFELCAVPLTANAIVEGLRVNGHSSITLDAVESCLALMIKHRLLSAEAE